MGICKTLFMKYDICSIGYITRDKIVTPDNTVYMAGGTAFYMTYGMSHLPRKVSYQLVTKVGDESREDIGKIRSLGFDTLCYPSRHTVFFENIYGVNSNDRRQRVRAKADPFTLEDVKNLNAKVFHLGSLLSDDFSPEVVEYLSTKGTISIDVQGYLREVVGEKVYAVDWKDKERVLHCTGILKLNESEMVAIAGSRDTHEVGQKLGAYGVKEVVMTLGSYGTVIYAGGYFYDIPAFKPRKVVDVTGCGDTFSTGYLWCRAQDMDIESSGRFAAAMCTLKLEHSGPFSGSIEDILQIEF